MQIVMARSVCAVCRDAAGQMAPGTVCCHDTESPYHRPPAQNRKGHVGGVLKKIEWRRGLLAQAVGLRQLRATKARLAG